MTVSVSKIFPGFIIGLGENDLAVTKINLEFVIGLVDGDLAVSKIVSHASLGPGAGFIASSAIKIHLVCGLGPSDILVPKIISYLVLYDLSALESDLFDPPAPTIESEATFLNHVVESDIASELDDSADEGLNSNHGVYSLVWKVLYASQVEYIEQYLIRRQGTKPFTYTIPTESTEKVFKCKIWEKTYNGGTWSMRAEFRQVFDEKLWEI